MMRAGDRAVSVGMVVRDVVRALHEARCDVACYAFNVIYIIFNSSPNARIDASSSMSSLECDV